MGLQNRKVRKPEPIHGHFVCDCVIFVPCSESNPGSTMWRQTALTLARCTRSILSRPGLYSGRVQAEWAPNAVLLSGSSSRFTPHSSEVRPLRAFSYDVAEGTSGTLFASQGEGFSRYGEKHLEEERSASSYGGMLSTFFATRANLERRLQEVLSQGKYVRM